MASGDVFGVFILGVCLFLAAVIVGGAATLSASARIGRARHAAEVLSDDVLVLLQRGEPERAREVAGAHGTPLADGILRLLSTVPSERSEAAGAIIKGWKDSVWVDRGLAYGCVVWGGGLVAALLLLSLVLSLAKEHRSTIPLVVAGLPGPLLGFWTLRHFARQIPALREELLAVHANCIWRMLGVLPPSGTSA